MSMLGQQEYDVIVIGAGMIGSAAAKYLRYLKPDWRILLIGPTEPKVRHPNKTLNKELFQSERSQLITKVNCHII